MKIFFFCFALVLFSIIGQCSPSGERSEATSRTGEGNEGEKSAASLSEENHAQPTMSCPAGTPKKIGKSQTRFGIERQVKLTWPLPNCLWDLIVNIVENKAVQDHLVAENDAKKWVVGSEISKQLFVVMATRSPLVGPNTTRFWVFTYENGLFTNVLKTIASELDFSETDMDGMPIISVLTVTQKGVLARDHQFDGVTYQPKK